jgi:AGZA family xanthine/uracil permease-like MFS transporter
MAYIIVVHPKMLQEASLPFGPMMTVTILITALATLMMGVVAKTPFACAPAMGVSAYFTFTLVQKNQLPVQEALFVAFIASFAILLLTLLKIRKRLIGALPSELSSGITGGIGLFLVTVALKQIGAVQLSSWGFMTWQSIPSRVTFLFLFGFLLIAAFERMRVQAALILSLLITWLLAWVLGFAQVDQLVAWPPSIEPLFLTLKYPSSLSFPLLKGLLSIFLVILFDSSAGLIVMKKALPEEAQKFSLQKALYPDATGSVIGSLLGTTPLAIHLESLAGIRSGARSGLTACIIALLFLSCLFLYPLASSIPQVASAPVVAAIGLLMAKELRQLFKLDKISAIAPWVFAIMMPLTMSIYQGFRAGFIVRLILSRIFNRKIEKSPLMDAFGAIFFIEAVLDVAHKL